MTTTYTLSSGRRCLLVCPELPLLPRYHVLSVPMEDGPPSDAETAEIVALAWCVARDLGRRFHGDPECCSVLVNGQRTRRMPWFHVHLLPVRSPHAKQLALQLLALKRVVRWVAAVPGRLLSRIRGEDPHGRRFRAAWRGAGCRGSGESVRQRLLEAWQEPHRRYHDVRHLHEGLDALATLAPHAGRPHELVLAWWFHDAVYDPTASDNEARSAAWAEHALSAAGAPEDVVQRVRALVLATDHHTPPTGGDAAVLIDADLSILGASPARFDTYERDVREEYAHLPDAAWHDGRRAVLAHLGERASLFTTPTGQALWEDRARHNLRRALANTALRHASPQRVVGPPDTAHPA